MNDGYVIVPTDRGYVVEYFNMNSLTLEHTVIQTAGPFDTIEEARAAERKMRQS